MWWNCKVSDMKGVYMWSVFLTAAMEGFFPSPAGGWVTSAPRKMTGWWKTDGLKNKQYKRTQTRCLVHLRKVCPNQRMKFSVKWNGLNSLSISLTADGVPICCWCRQVWHWSWDTGWRGSEGRSSPHSSPERTELPFPEECLQHVLLPLGNESTDFSATASNSKNISWENKHQI